MPRVLRIINRFNLGGPTFNAALLTKYMQPDFETLLIGGQAQESEESSKHILDELEIEGKLIEEMQRDIGLKNDRSAYKKILQLIRQYKPDIIHTHASKAGAIGRSAGIAYGKAKMIHTFHGHVFHSYFSPVKTNIYKNIERALALKTDKIIAISPRQKIELYKKHKICSAEKIAVIPLGFDLGKFNSDCASKRISFRSKFGLKDDEIAVGIIGRLAPIKNHRLFLSAFSNVIKKTDKKLKAFIVGDGSEAETLKSYTRSLGLKYANGKASSEKNIDVHFTSWQKEIDWVNAGLDIVALSSLNEGTPVSLIEAQASSKPILTTRVGGVIDIVKANETALVVQNDNEKAYTEKLLKLVEDKQLRANMGSKGWEHVNEKFHYSRLVKDMKSLYNEVLNIPNKSN